MNLEVMEVKCPTLMAVKIDNRVEDAPRFQELITKHGCMIKTRLGIHDVEGCSQEGLILLQICGEDENIQALGADINALKSTKAKWMALDF